MDLTAANYISFSQAVKTNLVKTSKMVQQDKIKNYAEGFMLMKTDQQKLYKIKPHV